MDITIDLIDVKNVTNEKAKQHELSGKEPISQALKIFSPDKRNITKDEIIKIFESWGFNTGVLFGNRHHADITAVTNIDGFIIPSWEKIVAFIAKIVPSASIGLLKKYSPGKRRLHVRLFAESDGSWIATAHTDWNWINITNIQKIYKAHFTTGAGDYAEGTNLLYEYRTQIMV